MTREELIERICPFDIACMCHSLDDNSINCSICKEELNKVLDEYDAKVRADERAKVIDHIEKYMLTDICSSCDQEACESGMVASIQECETIRFLKGAIHDAIVELKERSHE